MLLLGWREVEFDMTLNTRLSKLEQAYSLGESQISQLSLENSTLKSENERFSTEIQQYKTKLEELYSELEQQSRHIQTIVSELS